MKRNLLKLLKLIEEENKRAQASTLKSLNEYYTEKKPYILEGRGVRNWAKKTNAEKRAIIRQAYAEQLEQAKAGTLDLYNEAEDLKTFTARIEWARSYMWGYNPTAETWTNYGTYGRGTASGCGYDKLSASVQSSLSEKSSRLIKSALIKAYVNTGEKMPYGVYIWARGVVLSFGGCGESAIRGILEYCGLKNYRYISGKMFDYIEASR